MDVMVVVPKRSQSSSSFSFFNLLSSKQSHNSFFRKPFSTFCSTNKGDDDAKDNNNNTGDKFSTDWDKAWTRFKKQSKKSLFSQFSPNKYVSWNPRRSNYPLSEEVDPIKRTEKSNLMLWTSPKFTLFGAIIIVSFLLIYTILAPIK
ncbi:uncharacterized protein LOC141647703 [Silene latifolia]|uniref:uncharacterized protein LOC141647703 n=1 Tax=Silene latifolia TaxID=37657 RepID=UPI003D77D34F